MNLWVPRHCILDGTRPIKTFERTILYSDSVFAFTASAIDLDALVGSAATDRIPHSLLKHAPFLGGTGTFGFSGRRRGRNMIAVGGGVPAPASLPLSCPP